MCGPCAREIFWYYNALKFASGAWPFSVQARVVNG